ncbi:hypothetical protein RUR49_12410 [Pseudoxanthobacter sp. M-2]|uniref:hypothetical protein n=1 Tax=Pseudoxanthobacter sp. M-2 TaxID=3078754 RepID=UPI0038FCF6E4
MPVIVSQGASFRNFGLLARSPQPSGCLAIWDLTGGNAASARKSLVGDIEAADIGSPTWRRPGVTLDADNSLGTSISGGMEEMTLLGVFFRDPSTAYLGNHNASGYGDSLVETTGGVTRFRSTEVLGLDVFTFTLDLDNPCPQGAPFFFAASFTLSSVTATVGYRSRFYTKRATIHSRGLSTANLRIGTGNPTTLTDSPFVACGAGIWGRALNEGGFRAVYEWFKHRHERHGLQY